MAPRKETIHALSSRSVDSDTALKAGVMLVTQAVVTECKDPHKFTKTIFCITYYFVGGHLTIY